MVHATKGIVVRTTPYGDTSIVTQLYTALFGMQTYLVKGIRKSTAKAPSRAACFQPGAILDLIIYHQPNKNLQYIREFSWEYLYREVFSDVVKNAVAQFMLELVYHCLRQPEAHPELYDLLDQSLRKLDEGSPAFTGNLPLYFSLRLAAELGFGFQGSYDAQTPILDLKESLFIAGIPDHPYYLEGTAAAISAQLTQMEQYQQLELIRLNRQQRRELLEAYQHYLRLHVPGFGVLKSMTILQEIISD
ncbi:MAG TPA: DNA repair protein RecO [Sediminibacterium sp.]|nr:DNA repair protein RecO [Sediminibacterium sp.]